MPATAALTDAKAATKAADPLLPHAHQAGGQKAAPVHRMSPAVHFAAIQTARYPLPASNSSVNSPAAAPAVRATFAAPIFPLPDSRMSLRPRAFTIK